MNLVRYQTSWSFKLSFQKSDGKVDLIRGDALEVQPVHVFFTNEQFCNFIGTMAVQRNPRHRIDMIGENGAILLGQTFKRSSFGNDLLCNGGSILVQSGSDPGKGVSIVKELLDDASIFK